MGGLSPPQIIARLAAFFLNCGAWGPFLESPGNFSGLKSNIQIEI